MSQRSTLLQAAALVFVVTALGRLLGFVRDLVIAQYFGATSDTDAFLIAWMIPETVSPLLLEQAMALVLIPLFARELEREGTISGLLPRTLLPTAAALLVLSAAVALSASWTVPLLAPGLPASTELAAVRMVAIASITIFFIGLAGYARATLNSCHVFGVPAAVYAAYNLGILGSILLLHERLGIYSAALGLACGSALMLLVQVPTFVRKVGVPRLSFKLDRILLREFATFVPVGAFVLGRHAQVYVERFLGSFLEPGAISQLNYATRLGQFPMFVAAAIAIVSFPAVARAAVARRTGEVERAVESDLKMVSTLILPAAAYMIVFAPEVVALLLERGAFTAEDTAATASILRIYSMGLLAHTLIYITVQPFFTYWSSIWIPVRAALIGLAVTVAVDVTLLERLGADGLAIGNAVGISVMALILIRDLKRWVVNVDPRQLASFFIRALAAVLMASLCVLPLILLEPFAEMPPPVKLLLGGIILSFVYLLVGRLFGLEEFERLLNQARRVLSAGGRR